MITIEKLMNDTDIALCRHFTKTVNGVKMEPQVYDHTEEIFLDGEEGVSVWCDIPRGALNFFFGATSVIIIADKNMVCVNVFFGDKCIDPGTAEALGSAMGNFGNWSIENIDDFLSLGTSFSTSADVKEELSCRFAELLEDEFVEDFKELLACFR